eukprot:SAG31_NODE_3515_length_4170_cov_7.908131_2_plen_81_part_00
MQVLDGIKVAGGVMILNPAEFRPPLLLHKPKVAGGVMILNPAEFSPPLLLHKPLRFSQLVMARMPWALSSRRRACLAPFL